MSENSYQKSFHVEVDSIGQVNVPSDKYLGELRLNARYRRLINMLRYFY
jgi:hypothetical protein